MKKVLNSLILVCMSMSIVAQVNLEIDGKAKISVMEQDNTADSVVVRQSDGTLAVRHTSSLSEYQILSLSNDTLYLTNGGLVILTDTDLSNELQTISRTALDVTLSNGGGSYQDSVNVYTEGNGINITNNVISTIESPWYLGQDTLGGIVYYIYKGSDGLHHGLIVSYAETQAQWQSTTSTTTGDRTWDGVYNTGLMTNSPAKNWVTTNFSSEWYLPSIDELSLLWHNRFHANKSLSAGAHTLLSTTAAYWTSTERTATLAWAFNFSNGNAYSNYKTGTLSVRAIRAF